MSANTPEQVLVLPASSFPKPSNTLIPLHEALVEHIKKDAFFMDRPSAEVNPGFRQIIPYAVVLHDDHIFLMRRIKGSEEKRLHNLFSIGVGGHINPVDHGGEEPGFDILTEGLRRELEEEVGIKDYTAHPVGHIVLDDSEVSMVHAGVVYLVHSKDKPQVHEIDKLEGSLATLMEIKEVYEGLEGWSKQVFEWLCPPETGTFQA